GSPRAAGVGGPRRLPPVGPRLRPVGGVDVGRRPQQNSLVSLNRTAGVPVVRGVMLRNGLFAILALLALAAPAWAGGERVTAAAPVRDAGLLVVRLGSVHHDADGLGARVVGRRRHMVRQPLGVTPLLLRLLRALLDARPGVRLLKMGGPEMAPQPIQAKGATPPSDSRGQRSAHPGEPV